MDELKNIIGDYPAFLAQALKETREAGFDLSDFVQIDHMCYRVPSLERYELKKRELNTVGKLLGETRINDRPIAVFRLREPVHFEGWRIDAVEVPAPKPGVETKEGLEHIEMVLFDDKEAFLKKYAGKPFEMQAADRGINPEIVYRLSTCTVKFHLLSLPAVVYLEKKLGITEVRNDGEHPYRQGNR